MTGIAFYWRGFGRKLRDMLYKIVEKNNHNAVHSIGYYWIEKAQEVIDSGECIKHWMNKEAEFEVIEQITPINQ